MRRLFPDLWQTAQQKQFSSLTVHGYLLDRPAGNALFYNPRSTGDFEAIGDVGGISHHYLSHCHEVSRSLVDVAQRFGSELCCHALVERYLSGTMPADVYFSSPATEMHAGIEVIHTPGHTDNSVCYRYRSPHGRTYLFVGDTLYLDHGGWNTLVVAQDGGHYRDLAGSLALLRTLDVDVVICSVSVGDMKIVEVTRPEWHRIIDELLRPLAGA
ncbi:MAG: hypothetical protein OXH99_19010 [Bryobacterales bacterium]|nr:hypothetical protein [Bryobacterales bacterium]